MHVHLWREDIKSECHRQHKRYNDDFIFIFFYLRTRCLCSQKEIKMFGVFFLSESAPKRLTTPPNSKNSPKTGCAHCPQPGITDQENRNDLQLLGLSWWVWLSIGIGCLVVILLIVLVIILCKRIKRRKVREENGV